MLVVPAHGGLDDAMERLEVGRGEHGDAAPDQRVDFGQLDSEECDVAGFAHGPVPIAGG
jgi:hypothetical protein